MGLNKKALAGTAVVTAAAWKAGYTGKDVRVAVVDTGIDSTHPDFKGQVVATKNFTTGPAGDGFGHGTHVVSTIAGTAAASQPASRCRRVFVICAAKPARVGCKQCNRHRILGRALVAFSSTSKHRAVPAVAALATAPPAPPSPSKQPLWTPPATPPPKR
ncbi:S8 family serine peptidase [Kribbella sp. NPDC050124]|uniref:S8 family serine peptidase n=1 Tax=Kribbella sp. NPDC050124 TaxID=3364114 RepID=UPI0037AC0C3E